jgi:hypothetical protein
VTLDGNEFDIAPFDRRRAVRFAAIAIIGSALIGPEPSLADGKRVAAVMGTDRDFAALAQESDLRAAFDRYLASDSVLLRPLPEPGREWLANFEAPSGRYQWSPAGAIVSCDDSIAVTVGRWQYVPPQARTMETGEYLTAWRRDPQGDWKIVLDEAVDIPQLERIAQELEARTASACPRSSPSMRKLDAAEERANAAIRAASAAGSPTSLARRRSGIVVGAAQSDLVLTYGEVADDRAEPGSTRAVYVRIWQKARSDWSRVLEVVTPLAR